VVEIGDPSGEREIRPMSCFWVVVVRERMRSVSCDAEGRGVERFGICVGEGAEER
jgi:hypothetical protein